MRGCDYDCGRSRICMYAGAAYVPILCDISSMSLFEPRMASPRSVPSFVMSKRFLPTLAVRMVAVVPFISSLSCNAGALKVVDEPGERQAACHSDRGGGPMCGVQVRWGVHRSETFQYRAIHLNTRPRAASLRVVMRTMEHASRTNIIAAVIRFFEVFAHYSIAT